MMTPILGVSLPLSLRKGGRQRLVIQLVFCLVAFVAIAYWLTGLKSSKTQITGMVLSSLLNPAKTKQDNGMESVIEKLANTETENSKPTAGIKEVEGVDLNEASDWNQQAFRSDPAQDLPSSDVEVFISNTDYNHHCTWFRLPGREHPTPILCTYDPEYDIAISHHIHTKHTPWDAQDVAGTLDFLERADNNPPGHKERISLVDVGCNIGVFTVMATAAGFEVLAVDAMNTSLQFLATSLRANNRSSLVTLVHNAVSDKHEEMAVKQHKKGSINLSFVQSYSIDKSLSRGSSHLITHSVVKAVVMDDLVPYVRTSRVFLKMDIEGSEIRALKGSALFFSRLHVEGVLMEWANYRRTSADKEFMFRFMTQRGYTPYRGSTYDAPLSHIERSSWPKNVFWLKQ